MGKEREKMKSLADYQKFADELKALCEKHGIYLIGTCSSEAIYGEICLVDKDNPESCPWSNPLAFIGFTIYEDEYGGFFLGV